jgi:WD40 repeat protein
MRIACCCPADLGRGLHRCLAKGAPIPLRLQARAGSVWAVGAVFLVMTAGCSGEEAKPPGGRPPQSTARPPKPGAEEEPDLAPAMVEQVPVPQGIAVVKSASPGGPIVVVATDGTVHFVAVADGRIARVLKTTATAWAERMTSRLDASERPVTVIGIPVAVSGESVLVVEGDVLALYDESGRRFEQSRDPAWIGARVLFGPGEKGRVIALLRNGGLRIANGTSAMTSRPPVVASPVVGVHSETGNSLFLGGAEEAIVAVAGGGLGDVSRLPRRLGEPPILAIATDPTGKQVAVSHGTSCRVKTFALDSNGQLAHWDGHLKNGPSCLALDYNSDGLLLAAGLADGRVLVTSVGNGTERPPHELQVVQELKVSDSEVVGVWFCADSSDFVCCTRGGVVARYSYKNGAIQWSISLALGQPERREK